MGRAGRCSIGRDVDTHGGVSHSIGRPGARRIHRGGFTLVEVLVVVGIIVVLLSILLPAMGKMREQSNSVACAANLHSIGHAFQVYLTQYDHYTFPWRNFTYWVDPNTSASKPNQLINAYDPNAYWGVPYAVAGGLSKETFGCPSHQQKSDAVASGSAGYANRYVDYGLNGWGDAYSGFDDPTRKKFFPGTNYNTTIALFRTGPSGGWSDAVGRNVTALSYPSQTIVAQDAWEPMLDGNGDTFASPSASSRGKITEYTGHDVEYLRHQGYSNVLFLDGHVERLGKQDQSDERYYTGRWDLQRAP